MEPRDPDDRVFGALDDTSRRLLLDRLLDRDGQTLGELCEHLPAMTRYGVMNHLRILEDAGLVVTEKVGRSKHHYLNPVPIELIRDRWISRFAAPHVGALARLKARVEQGDTSMSNSTTDGMNTPVHVYQAYINGPIGEVWRAITDPDRTEQYFYGTRVESTWEVGAEMNYRYPDGRLASEGRVIAIDEPNRLEFTFQALWDEALIAEGPAREVWALAETNGMTVLTIEIYDLPADGRTLADFSQGLPYIVSGLKSLIETGAPLPAPG